MAISNTLPPASYLRGGKRVFPFNIATKQVADPQTNKTRTQYEYEEWEMGAEATDEQVATAKIVVERKAQAAKDYQLLTALAGRSDAQIGEWVDKNVTDLASAKGAIRLLARAVGMLACLVVNDK